jgi:hypothetical protein
MFSKLQMLRTCPGNQKNKIRELLLCQNQNRNVVQISYKNGILSQITVLFPGDNIFLIIQMLAYL